MKRYLVTYRSSVTLAQVEFSTRNGAEAFAKFKRQCGYIALVEDLGWSPLL